MDNQPTPTNQVDHEIEKLLEAVAQEEGFCDFKIEKAPGTSKGDGYMGVITSVRITGTNQLKEKKVLDLVVKSAPKSDTFMGETPIGEMFAREIYMYSTIFPAFRRFEVEKGLPPFPSSPKCFRACVMGKSQVLVLENLKEKGYSLYERRIPMDRDHVSFVMAEYGRYHALPLAVRDQNPELFQKLYGNMDDVFQKCIIQGNWLEMFTNQCIKALDALDPVTDKDARKAFKSFIDEELPAFFLNLEKLRDKYSINVHGDCWTNNMLFKYRNQSEPSKPTDMCLIDLQLARLGPSVMDLSFFLYSCGSKEIINDFEHYMKVYHDSLSAYLRKLGSNPDEVYPYSVLRRQWKETAKFGLVWSMLLIYVMLTEQHEVTDAESGKSIADVFDYDIGRIEEYNDRVRHVILHFVSNDFL